MIHYLFSQAVSFDTVSEFSLENMQETQAFWDNLWAATYSTGDATTPTLTIAWTASIAKIFLLMLIPVWVYFLARTFSAGSDFQAVSTNGARFMIAGFLCFVLLGGNSAQLASVQSGFREVFKGMTQQSLTLSIADQTLRDATNDQLLTHQTRNEILADITQCNSMPAPPVAIPGIVAGDIPESLSQEQQQLIASFKCWETLAEKVDSSQNENLPLYCLGQGQACRSFLDFMGRLGTTLDQAIDTELNKVANGDILGLISPVKSVADLFAGTVAWGSLKTFLEPIQWFYITSLEMAFWLSGLVTPFMATMLLIPQFSGAFWQWAIYFFAFGLNQVLYSLLIGLFSILLETQTGSLNISSLGFPMLVTLGAPIVSSGLIWLGASRVTSVLVNQGIDVGFGSLALAAGVAGGIARSAQASSIAAAATQRKSSLSGVQNES